ncbi:MAG: M16 family metallopeptidase [Alphaproteobacteria bacterium]
MATNYKKSIFIKILFLTLWGLVSFSSGALAEIYVKGETFVLDNGLTVAVIPQKRAPIINHMIWYNVGSNDEISGKSGLAHFNEHLMFRGSQKIPDGDFSKIIALNGGEDNAFTYRNYTAYHQTIASNRLDLVMAMEADRMEALNLSQDVFDAEHKVIIEERLTRYENNPSALLNERMMAALWYNNNLGISVIGTMEDIKNLELNDVNNFHQTWYAPNNAYVVIAGDVDLEEAKKLAIKNYGSLKPKVLPKKKNYPMPPSNLDIKITLPHSLVLQKSLLKYYAVPPETKDNETFILSLDLLSEILGNPSVGKLYRNLVENNKKATAVGCSYSFMTNYPSVFSFYGYPRDNKDSLSQLGKDIENEIKNIASGNLTEQDVNLAQERIIANMVYLEDSPNTLANLVGEMLVSGRKLDDINKYPDKIKKITAQDIIDAASFLTNKTAKITGYLIPLEKTDDKQN